MQKIQVNASEPSAPCKALEPSPPMDSPMRLEASRPTEASELWGEALEPSRPSEALVLSLASEYSQPLWPLEALGPSESLGPSDASEPSGPSQDLEPSWPQDSSEPLDLRKSMFFGRFGAFGAVARRESTQSTLREPRCAWFIKYTCIHMYVHV